MDYHIEKTGILCQDSPQKSGLRSLLRNTNIQDACPAPGRKGTCH